ncbi:MAG TPA: NAD(P)-dependent oxidoreductase [Mucilaginibacter sp.]
MKVLVTGSSGRLGSVTVNHLRQHGHEVCGIDRITSATTDVLIDIQDKEQVEKATHGFDAIIHTAAVHGRHYELNYPRQSFIDTNITGTLQLLNACVKNGISRFLFTSTTSIYGNALVDERQAAWADELLPEQPRDIYDITKQTAEQLCKDFFYKDGLQTSIYRVARFLPEDDNIKLNHRLYRGLDERDGAEALRMGLRTNFASLEVFNISSGSPFGKADLVALKHHPKEVILRYFPQAEAIYRDKGYAFPKSIDRVYVCDKARVMLGYRPQYTFEYLLHL